VQELNSQRESLDCHVRVVVAINGDAEYSAESLRSAGADVVLDRPFNLGGNANICLGYEWFANSDYLWILSDDETLHPAALSTVLRATATHPDLIVGTHGLSHAELIRTGGVGDIERRGGFLDLISSTIYRSELFMPLVEVAFEFIFTNYPHACLVAEAERRREISQVLMVPLSELVDFSASAAAVKMPRSITSVRLAPAFYGGALAKSMGEDNKFAKKEFRRWWQQHWHRAAMYRRTRSVQQQWVDRMARSSLDTALWWLASLPPYWRLKDRIRPLDDAPDSHLG
jgi:hypothetical protein